MNHLEHGMITVFTVTDANQTVVPTADLTITLGDDAITVPTLTAGTHVIAVTNTGTQPHGMNTGGVPSGTDLSRGEEIGAWMEGGQDGPPPLPIDFPGGLKAIAPGTTVVLTLTLKTAHTYMFSYDHRRWRRGDHDPGGRAMTCRDAKTWVVIESCRSR